MGSNKLSKKLHSPYKFKDRDACRFGPAAKTGLPSKSKYFAQILFIILFIFTFIPIAALTSCKFEKLGLSLNSPTSLNDNENNISVTNAEADVLNEQGFYSLKNLQKDKNPLIDINVRKAVFYAIDRNRIASELLGSYGEVLNSLFPVGADYYADSWSQYDYDPTTAKEYLNKAGYNESNPLLLTIGANSDSPSRQIIENIIKENLDAIGIVTWVANKEAKVWYMEDIRSGNYDLGVWSIYIPDSAGIEDYFSSGKIPSMETDTNKNCNNFYWYSNPDFDAYLDTLLKEDNIDKKIPVTSQMQKILSDDAIILPLYSRIYAVAYNKKLSGVEIDTLSGSVFKNIAGMDINIESDTKTQSKSSSTENKGNIKSLVAGYEQEPYVLNPFITDSIYREYINSLIVQGLWKKTGPDKYEPVLAESFTVMGDGQGTRESTDLRYSLKAAVKLKNDIYWEDGDPIIADDVVATINAIMSDKTLTFEDKDFGIIKSIEKTGNKEFVVTFNEFDRNWEQLFNYVFPAKLLLDSKISSLFGEDIFGSGPYKLKEWKKGEYVLLEKNNRYLGEKPSINEIKFLFNSDINYLVGMLQEGNIDILGIPADLALMKSIEEDENLSLEVAPGYLFEHLAICLKPEQ
jgi:ABC-type transport system substrate-binding protein